MQVVQAAILSLGTLSSARSARCLEPGGRGERQQRAARCLFFSSQFECLPSHSHLVRCHVALTITAPLFRAYTPFLCKRRDTGWIILPHTLSCIDDCILQIPSHSTRAFFFASYFCRRLVCLLGPPRPLRRPHSARRLPQSTSDQRT